MSATGADNGLLIGSSSARGRLLDKRSISYVWSKQKWVFCVVVGSRIRKYLKHIVNCVGNRYSSVQGVCELYGVFDGVKRVKVSERTKALDEKFSWEERKISIECHN